MLIVVMCQRAKHTQECGVRTEVGDVCGVVSAQAAEWLAVLSAQGQGMHCAAPSGPVYAKPVALCECPARQRSVVSCCCFTNYAELAASRASRGELLFDFA